MLSLRFETTQRYYQLTLEQDLFDDWIVLCVYGGRNSKLGNIKKYPYHTYYEAFNKLINITMVRHRHTYKLVDFKSHDTYFMYGLYLAVMLAMASSSYYLKLQKVVAHFLYAQAITEAASCQECSANFIFVRRTSAALL